MILNLCTHDYANFMYDNMLSLQAIGVNCVGLKRKKHIFNYHDQCRIARDSEIKETISHANTIQIFHSDLKCLSLVNQAEFKGQLIVYHTGTNYRQNHELLNSRFNAYVDRSVVALTEFIGLGSKNEVYVVGAVNTDYLVPIPIPKPEFRFGHFPSDPEVKGTKKILSMMYGHDLCYSTDQFSYEYHISRMRSCRVYVELFAPTQNGKPYGSFGISALEAAALGLVVITQCFGIEHYWKTYGKPVLFLTKDKYDFMATIETLSQNKTPEKEIKTLQSASRKWVVEKHSHQATGQYILDNVL